MPTCTRATAPALLAVAIMAAGCVVAARTPAQELASARWKDCDNFAGVELERIDPDGKVWARAAAMGEATRWEQCMRQAAARQARVQRRAEAREAEVSLTPIAGFKRELCGGGIVAVRSPWDRAITEVYGRLLRAADPDLHGADLAIVVVKSNLMPGRPAFACGYRQHATIAVTAVAVAEVMESPEPPILLARLIAHELAHVSLGHLDAGRVANDRADEIDADTLGTYYFERAGYDCRRWVGEITRVWRASHWASADDERRGISKACDAAKRGERVPARRYGAG
jgi:hypothetical protein